MPTLESVKLLLGVEKTLKCICNFKFKTQSGAGAGKLIIWSDESERGFWWEAPDQAGGCASFVKSSVGYVKSANTGAWQKMRLIKMLDTPRNTPKRENGKKKSNKKMHL